MQFSRALLLAVPLASALACSGDSPVGSRAPAPVVRRSIELVADLDRWEAHGAASAYAWDGGWVIMDSRTDEREHLLSVRPDTLPAHPRTKLRLTATFTGGGGEPARVTLTGVFSDSARGVHDRPVSESPGSGDAWTWAELERFAAAARLCMPYRGLRQSPEPCLAVLRTRAN